MEWLEVWRTRGEHRCLVFRTLRSPLQRLRGLLLTGCDADPVAIMRCSSIHTFGMSYRIDVAFVDERGTVLETHRAVAPAKVLRNRRAKVTLERPHARTPWFDVGETLVFRKVEGARIAT